MKVIMIRHGETKGNREKRYVGSTDEEITNEARDFLVRLGREKYQWLKDVDCLYVSPMIRCKQTADILFPDKPGHIIHDFRECEFGEFEYMNYVELKDDFRYQAYIDSGGQSGFPGGETKEVFQKRCIEGLHEVLKDIEGIYKKTSDREITLALVVHGGTIMSLLDAFSAPHRDYFDWQISNGRGYIMDLQIEKEQLILHDILPI